MTVTKHPQGCLLVFPHPDWLNFRAHVAALPEEAKGWKRFFIGGAMDVEVDSAARALIPPELRAFAALDRDVMLLGMDTHFELWDVARHTAQEADVMQQGLPDALKKLNY